MAPGPLCNQRMHITNCFIQALPRSKSKGIYCAPHLAARLAAGQVLLVRLLSRDDAGVGAAGGKKVRQRQQRQDHAAGGRRVKCEDGLSVVIRERLCVTIGEGTGGYDSESGGRIMLPAARGR